MGFSGIRVQRTLYAIGLNYRRVFYHLLKASNRNASFVISICLQ